jgi:hypothetical protein
MASCAAIGDRRSSGLHESCGRRIANPPQDAILPHKNSARRAKKQEDVVRQEADEDSRPARKSAWNLE